MDDDDANGDNEKIHGLGGGHFKRRTDRN